MSIHRCGYVVWNVHAGYMPDVVSPSFAPTIRQGMARQMSLPRHIVAKLFKGAR